MKQYQSYRQEQERYEDDMEEILDECEVYREIEERERMENYDDIEAQTKEQKKNHKQKSKFSPTQSDEEQEMRDEFPEM